MNMTQAEWDSDWDDDVDYELLDDCDSEVRYYVSTMQTRLAQMCDDQSLQAAIGFWICIGQLLERYISGYIVHLTIAGRLVPVRPRHLSKLECLLFQCHEEAVRILVSECDSRSFDGSRIEIAGRFCRDILFRGLHPEFKSNETPSPWSPRDLPFPKCFELLSLPVDVRSAIVESDRLVAQLSQLMRRARIEQNDLVSMQDIGVLVGLARSSMPTIESLQLGHPVQACSGSRPAKWSYLSILPTLRERFTQVVFPDSCPKRPLKPLQAK